MRRNTSTKVWIDRELEMIFEARPIDDVVNDGADPPANKRIKWVVFRVFTRERNLIDYDAVGYAESIAKAKQGIYAD